MTKQKSRVRSRADHPAPGDAAYFDFNEPKARLASIPVSARRVGWLLDRLDRADELFGSNARAGAIASLDAVVTFLRQIPLDKRGRSRLSRPLALLAKELATHERPKDAGRILPERGSNARKKTRGRASDAEIKAAGAVALHLLRAHASMSVSAGAEAVALILRDRGFRFGGRRDPSESAGAAVADWRKNYLSERKAGSAVTPLALRYLEKQKIKFGADRARNRELVLSWFSDLLARAGYGSTA